MKLLPFLLALCLALVAISGATAEDKQAESKEASVPSEDQGKDSPPAKAVTEASVPSKFRGTVAPPTAKKGSKPTPGDKPRPASGETAGHKDVHCKEASGGDHPPPKGEKRSMPRMPSCGEGYKYCVPGSKPGQKICKKAKGKGKSPPPSRQTRGSVPSPGIGH